MSNSSLISYTKISPNKNSPRGHVIDTVSIHCMAGDLSVETCGNLFAQPAKAASSNYGIGTDGRIALYVDEGDRSWCTSSASNDNRAITIEVANDGGADTGWHVSDEAYKSLINLLADICQRNGIKKLLWQGDKSLIGQVDKQNMTVHRWFAAKACPGDYLYNLHGQIADEVNAQLEKSASKSTKTTKTNSKATKTAAKTTAKTTTKTATKTTKTTTVYKVQTGAFKDKANAQSQAKKLKAKGFDTLIVEADSLYKVQTGAFKDKANAQAQVTKLKAKGFTALIMTDKTTSTTNTASIAKGSKVKLKSGAKTYTGGSLASYVYTRTYTVSELSGDRAVITYEGTVVAAVKTSDLTAI